MVILKLKNKESATLENKDTVICFLHTITYTEVYRYSKLPKKTFQNYLFKS